MEPSPKFAMNSDRGKNGMPDETIGVPAGFDCVCRYGAHDPRLLSRMSPKKVTDLPESYPEQVMDNACNAPDQ
jgi:hypothetical protein